MADFLRSIPASLFELIGIIAGLTGCLILLIQLIKESKSNNPSSLTTAFLMGWLFIYAFWGLYGMRFETIALWFTIAIAFVLQLILCTVVFKKKIRQLNQ
tara:strand:+ start:289760 stop:290059 length:300 start_codon:yes stop_codon:yes gene_type:complete